MGWYIHVPYDAIQSGPDSKSHAIGADLIKQPQTIFSYENKNSDKIVTFKDNLIYNFRAAYTNAVVQTTSINYMDINGSLSSDPGGNYGYPGEVSIYAKAIITRKDGTEERILGVTVTTTLRSEYNAGTTYLTSVLRSSDTENSAKAIEISDILNGSEYLYIYYPRIFVPVKDISLNYGDKLEIQVSYGYDNLKSWINYDQDFPYRDFYYQDRCVIVQDGTPLSDSNYEDIISEKDVWQQEYIDISVSLNYINDSPNWSTAYRKNIDALSPTIQDFSNDLYYDTHSSQYTEVSSTKCKFEHLPKYITNTYDLIDYKLYSIGSADYYSGPIKSSGSSNDFYAKYTLNFKSFDYSVVINDNNNQDGLRPNSDIYLETTISDTNGELYSFEDSFGTSGGTITKSIPTFCNNSIYSARFIYEGDEWKDYTITVSGNTITLTRIAETVTVSGTIEWSGDYYTNEKLSVTLLPTGSNKSVQKSFTFNNLPKYESGVLVDYSIEVSVPEGWANAVITTEDGYTYKIVVYPKHLDGYIFTNNEWHEVIGYIFTNNSWHEILNSNIFDTNSWKKSIDKDL